jgi:Protein of unknown function DUF115
MTEREMIIGLDAIDLEAPMSMPTLAPLNTTLGAVDGRIGLPEYVARVHAAMAAKHASLARHIGVGRGRALIICGGGPSIGDIAKLKAIRALAKKGGKIWAVNKTHDFLLSKGITPWAACLLDPMAWVANYISKPQRGVLYALASQCHADVFAALKGYAPHVWHAGIDAPDGTGYPTELLQRDYAGQDWLVIPGPTTVGLRSILVGYALGFRAFHLFGLDSSMRGAQLHAYAKAKPTDAPEGWVSLRTKAGTQKFFTNSHMARQALDFEETTERIAEMVRTKAMAPIRITVHGEGLLPELAKCYGWHASQGALHG